MTTETERAVPRQVPAPLPVGGQVMAIVPQSFEEIQRMANTVIVGGLAPSSLIKWASDNDTPEQVQAIGRRNVAAVAGVLMAGAELGVPPMAALRLFTSINGRPALYADGNIAVARRAKDVDGKKVAETIASGVEMIFDYGCPYCNKKRESKEDVREHIAFAHKDQDPTEPAILILSDRTYGWCEAKRADTGEVKREEFSISDAKTARLWDDNMTVTKYGWHTDERGKRVQGNHTVQNDSPWHRYWKRMLKWRATGYCLRDLFADVLAGMVDEFEAREIEGMIDLTPLPPPSRPQPPTPPAEEDENQDAANEPAGATEPAHPATQMTEPAMEEGMTLAEAEAEVARQAELQKSDQQEGGKNEVAEPEGEQHIEEGEAPPPTPPTFDDEQPKPDTSDVAKFLNLIDETLAATEDDEQLIIQWEELDAQHEFADDEDALTRAFEIKEKHEERIKRLLLNQAGQTDIFGGGEEG